MILKCTVTKEKIQNAPSYKTVWQIKGFSNLDRLVIENFYVLHYISLYTRPIISTRPLRRVRAPSAGEIQKLRYRLTASSGEPGSSHGTVLATTHFPLEATAHHPVKGGRLGRYPPTDVQGRNRTSDRLNLRFHGSH